MKILAIRGKNLASLEGEFCIDFTQEPLASAGIFAISGNTGAGKSTILDAICLALYNDTPRINRANDNADIKDVKEFTVKQKDCRNILRRGTSDGYAEVDFLSLQGEPIRARWSVRRSRDKADGSLQNSTYNVYSLKNNTELQGTKTELLRKVSNLIGLTFDQFTRAVLLAQGDFATFLKSGSKEKAELLEKLTGTDIYSRISSKIFENTKQADLELKSLQDKINDLELLPPDILLEYNNEKNTINIDVKSFETDYEEVKNKISWLEVFYQINDSIEKATKNLKQVIDNIKENDDRFKFIDKVELAQKIRDIYLKFNNNKKQLVLNNESFSTNNDLLIIKKGELDSSKLEFNSIDKEHNSLLSKWELVEPQIKEAREIDVIIKEKIIVIDSLNNEINKLAKLLEDIKIDIRSNNNKIKLNTDNQSSINEWFKDNNKYESLVLKIDMYSSLINDYYLFKSNITNSENILKDLNEILNEEQKQLLNEQNEFERLNKLIPSEIIALREKLDDNLPCPVCGSLEHPFKDIIEKNLEENLINNQKLLIEKNIERLKNNIDIHKNEIVKINSSNDNYRDQLQNLESKFNQDFTPIKNWPTLLDNGEIVKFLNDLSTKWNKNTALLQNLKNEAAILNKSIVDLNKRVYDTQDNLTSKNKNLEEINNDFNIIKEKRSHLLKGYKTDDIEKAYKEKIKLSDTKLKESNNKISTLSANIEKLEGIIISVNQNSEMLLKENLLLEKELNNWYSNNELNINDTEVEFIFSQSYEWINNEKQFLSDLNKSKLTILSTLDERNRVLKNHLSSEFRVPDTVKLEDLKELLDTYLDKLNVLKNRLAFIDVQLLNHHKSLEKNDKYSKEINLKSVYVDNWRKLNDLFGSADGAKFKLIAQGYTLDILLGYANSHLRNITHRYVLERVNEYSLSLQVIDLDMLSEVRSVHSLSGGESFLISLSLALGLSSLSSNKMRIESLFIDEGFGSLDADTLGVAMDALEKLQTQGRKIGVISHVAEMSERIGTQIKVVKQSNGKSIIIIE